MIAHFGAELSEDRGSRVRIAFERGSRRLPSAAPGKGDRPRRRGSHAAIPDGGRLIAGRRARQAVLRYIYGTHVAGDAPSRCVGGSAQREELERLCGWPFETDRKSTRL